MTLDALRYALAAAERALASRVAIWRVIIDPDGRELRRIHTRSFQAPLDWCPPTLDDLIAAARGVHKKKETS